MDIGKMYQGIQHVCRILLESGMGMIVFHWSIFIWQGMTQKLYLVSCFDEVC